MSPPRLLLPSALPAELAAAWPAGSWVQFGQGWSSPVQAPPPKLADWPVRVHASAGAGGRVELCAEVREPVELTMVPVDALGSPVAQPVTRELRVGRSIPLCAVEALPPGALGLHVRLGRRHAVVAAPEGVSRLRGLQWQPRADGRAGRFVAPSPVVAWLLRRTADGRGFAPLGPAHPPGTTGSMDSQGHLRGVIVAWLTPDVRYPTLLHLAPLSRPLQEAGLDLQTWRAARRALRLPPAPIAPAEAMPALLSAARSR